MARRRFGLSSHVVLILGAVAIAAVLVWQGTTAGGNPDPLAAHVSPRASILYIGVLVFREGLECILVLAAVTAGMTVSSDPHRQPIVVGVCAALACTALTWCIAIRAMDDLTTRISALTLQASTGLLAIIVLLVVMNWFFHKMYWTGWISLHTKRKTQLLQQVGNGEFRGDKLWWGFVLLGFTSVYREGFEVVLFLQSYRLKLGERPVLAGVLAGVLLSVIIAALTFVAHRHLPYRRMLVLTGVLLGAVLLVMVGEEAQEMQLAHWLPKTEISPLVKVIPAWMGVWLSIFPTVETLVAQGVAGGLVLGSFAIATSEKPQRNKATLRSIDSTSRH